MGKSLQTYWRNSVETVNDANTVYVMVGGSSIETDNSSTSERPVRHDGTFSNLRCRITANGVTAASTFTMMASTVATALSVSIPASTTGWFEDTSNSAAMVAADEANMRMATGVGGTSLDLKMIGSEFDSDSDTVSLIGMNSSGSSSLNASETDFYNVIGGRNANTDEDIKEYRIGEACVWQDLTIAVGSNAHDTATVVSSRINNADGNQTISVPALTGGWHEDTSNTDSLSADDDIVYQVATGAATTGQFNVEKITSSLVSTDNEWFIGIHGNDNRQLDNVTGYWPLSGELGNAEAAEADAQVEASFDFTAKELITKITRMSGGVTATYVLRVNGVTGNMSTVHTAVGIQTDTANTDTITAGDDINYQFSSPVGGTNFDTAYIGFIGDNGGAPPAAFNPAWYYLPNQY